MDVTAHGATELSEAELREIRGGCDLFCDVLRQAGKAYQNTREGLASAYDYVRASDTGTPSYYSW